jgi:hypothetical protein
MRSGVGKLIGAVGIAGLACLMLCGAGTTTITTSAFSTVHKVTFNWTSDASGDADTTSPRKYNGQILGVTVVPAAEPNAPSDAYDVLLKNQDGADIILSTALANLDSIPTYEKYTLSGATVNALAALCGDNIRIIVSNAGNANSGTINVYFR